MPRPQGGHGGLQEGARVEEACARGYPGSQNGGRQRKAGQADVVGGARVGQGDPEIKRNWVPRSDNKNKENNQNDQNKDKDKKGKGGGKGGRKKGVNDVEAEENTPSSTTDAP